MAGGHAGPPLLDVDSGDRPRDDQALDLRGPLEDRVDLRVAVPALDRVFAHVAVAAHDLDRLLRHPDRGLAGEELRHRAFAVLELLPIAAHPGRPPDEEPAGVDARLHVGELEGDRLVLDDRPAELLPFLRVIQRELVGSPRDTHGLGADGRPRRLERRHRRLYLGALALAGAGEALVEALLAAEKAAAGNAHVVENDLCRVAGADAVLLELLAHAQARRARRHDERGVSARVELGIDR